MPLRAPHGAGMSDETPEITIRRIVRATPRAALATNMRDRSGSPYVSLVMIATDPEGAPLLLLSDLAEHTQNLEADPRAGLLLDATGHHGDPLAGERVSLIGWLARTDDPVARRRYLARHPAASMYAGFGDFAFWCFSVERAHLVAGFGRIHWVDRGRVTTRPAPALAEAEADIVDHMNQDHADALQLYGDQLLGLGPRGWVMTGIDPDGVDLRAGADVARLDFGRRVEDAGAARAELVRLAQVARARAAGDIS